MVGDKHGLKMRFSKAYYQEADLRVADVCVVGLLCQCLVEWRGPTRKGEEKRCHIKHMLKISSVLEAAFAHTRQCYIHSGWKCTPKVLVVVVLCCPLQKALQTSNELVIAEHSHTARKAPCLTTM